MRNQWNTACAGLVLGAGLFWTGCAPTPSETQQAEAAAETAEQAPGVANRFAPARQQAAPRAPQPVRLSIAEGTQLRVRTTTALSSKSAQTGQSFTANLVEPLSADGRVLAPAGATVTGVVADSDPGGRVKGVARLVVRLTQVQLADGRTVEIQTNSIAREAAPTKKKDATKIGIGSGVGAAIGAIAGGGKGAAIGAASGAGAGTGVVLATRGDPAVIGSESVLTFTLRSPVSATL
jgi:hypothetical protein